MPVLDPSQWPEELKHPAVKGVFVHGCIEKGDGVYSRNRAHAHTAGEHAGWICVYVAKRLKFRELMLHELGHLVVGPGHGHNDKWRSAVLALGGTIDVVTDYNCNTVMRSYAKKPRTRWCTCTNGCRKCKGTRRVPAKIKRKRAAKPKTKVSAAEKREAKARAMFAKWDAELRRVTKVLDKWATKVRYYDRRAEKKIGG